MAITAYTGPPGAGKSHALVSQVILSAVFAGRRVVSNIDGLNPNAIRAYCLERPELWSVDHADKLGEVVLFHGEDSQLAGFWPTEQTERAGEVTFVRPGDLVAFDEWAMFFPSGARTEAAERVEQFMRWHRHLTHPDGHATDLAIATQSIGDFHRRHRPLISTSYLFKKLSAVGASNSYTWHAYQGRLQKTAFQTGTSKYDPAIFPLYASSTAAGQGKHTELKTDKRGTIWSKGLLAMIAAGVVVFCIAIWRAWAFFNPEPMRAPDVVAASAAGTATPGAPAAPARSPWRIAGTVIADQGFVVVLMNDDGRVRLEPPGAFEFREDRPMRGLVDGMEVLAEDRAVLRATEGVVP